jgi:hypothetical protein
MTDDPLSRFTNKLKGKPPAAPKAPALPPSLVVNHDNERRQPYDAYEPFDNQVRSTNIELRIHRTGLSHFIAYANISGLTFNFRTGGEISFIGDGCSVVIKGRSLRAIIIAINMHTCGLVQDFDPSVFVMPQPMDSGAPWVESIAVEVLRAPGASRKPEDE